MFEFSKRRLKVLTLVWEKFLQTLKSEHSTISRMCKSWYHPGIQLFHFDNTCHKVKKKRKNEKKIKEETLYRFKDLSVETSMARVTNMQAVYHKARKYFNAQSQNLQSHKEFVTFHLFQFVSLFFSNFYASYFSCWLEQFVPYLNTHFV